MELKQLYEAAPSEYERREVCFRAIDEGTIHRSGSISTLRTIFGTHFVSLEEEGTVQRGFVDFLELPVRPKTEEVSAGGHIWWSMRVSYDQNGVVKNYYLSNIHKWHSSYQLDGPPTSIAELNRLYQGAKSEYDRRAVCLRAIDEGVIRTDEPVSTVDSIFGTGFASDLPNKKESQRTAWVYFAPPVTSDKTAKEVPRAEDGWFMALEYDYRGDILNYYLTNVRD